MNDFRKPGFEEYILQKLNTQQAPVQGVQSVRTPANTKPGFEQYLLKKYNAAPVTAPASMEEPGLVGDVTRTFGGGVVKGTGLAVEGLGNLGQMADEYFNTGGDQSVSSKVAEAGLWIQQKADELLAGRSTATQQALENSRITGTLWKPETWDWGSDPSLRGIGLQAVEVMGQLVPILAAGVTGRAAGSMAAGGLQGGEAGRDTAEQLVEEAYFNGSLYDTSPMFKRLIDEGMDQEEAYREVRRRSGNFGQIFTTPVSALGGLGTQAVFTGKATELIGRTAVGKTLAGRVLGTGAVGAVEEGVEEISETLASKAGTQAATGMVPDYGEGTFADFALGAMAGGPVGAVGGVAAPPPNPLVEESDVDQFGMEEADIDVESAPAQDAAGGVTTPENAYKPPMNTPETTPITPAEGDGASPTGNASLGQNISDDVVDAEFEELSDDVPAQVPFSVPTDGSQLTASKQAAKAFASDPLKGALPSYLMYKGEKPTGTAKGGVYYDTINQVDTYVKTYPDNLQVGNEAAALHIAQMVGNGFATTPELLRGTDGKSYLATKDLYNTIDPNAVAFNKDDPNHKRILSNDFMMHAWLANWDVVGKDYGNVMISESEQKPIYFDMGGALLYRGLQGKKGLKFSKIPTEVKNFKDAAMNPEAYNAFDWGYLTLGQLAQQIDTLTDDVYNNYAAIKNSMAAKMGVEGMTTYNILMDRLAYLYNYYSLGDPITASTLLDSKFTEEDIAAAKAGPQPVLKKHMPGLGKNLLEKSKFAKNKGIATSAEVAKLFGPNLSSGMDSQFGVYQKLFNTPEYQAMINSTNFKNNYVGNTLWFNPQNFQPTLNPTGFPLVVWHSTPSSNIITPFNQKNTFNNLAFTSFDKGFAKSGVGSADTAYGFYLAMPHTSWGGGAETFIDGVPLVIKAENPKLVEARGIKFSATYFKEQNKAAKMAGHDFVVYYHVQDAYNGTQIVGLYDAAEPKIKHLNNIGTWSFDKTSNLYAELIKPWKEEAQPLAEVNQAVFDKKMEEFGIADKVKLTVFSRAKAKQRGYAGFFKKNSAGMEIGISNANGDTEVTFNHEVMHALIEMGFFTQEEVRLLKGMAKRVWSKRYGITQAYHELPVSEQWKEAAAHAFGDWTVGARVEHSAVSQLFDKISRFFQAIVNWARGYGFQTSEDIFEFLTNRKAVATRWDTFHSDYAGRALDNDIDTMYMAMEKLGVKPTKKLPIDYYGKLVKYGWTVVQLAKKNVHIPWLQEYVQYCSQWHGAKTEWLSRANETASIWMNISSDQQRRLAEMLIEAEETVTYRSADTVEQGKLTQQEVDLVKKHKLGAETLKLYVRVRGDFRAMLNKIEQVVIDGVRNDLADNELTATIEIAKIEKEFNGLKKTAYFPHARFGTYTIIVKDKAGKNVHVEMFESERERNKAEAQFRKAYPKLKGYTVATSKLSEEAEIYKGIPHALLIALKNNLKLDAKQNAALEEMLVHSLPAVSFKKHFVKKKNIAGFSRDALRAYADYFWHGANHIARVEYGPKMDQALTDAQTDISKQISLGGDTTNRVKIMDHLKSHKDSIMNPKQDWAALRSVGFLWWLGFNVKSAVLNLTQVPLVTHSYLAANFGDAQSLTSLTKQMTELRTMYRSPEKAANAAQEVDLKLIARGIQEGFLDESFAAELAGLAEGDTLVKSAVEARKRVNQFMHAASYMFQTVEKFNRRVSFMAAVKLARGNPNVPYLETVRQRYSLEYKALLEEGMSPQEASAYLAGKDTVESTQFNYAAWARPKIMEGRKSAFLTFFMFTQNMLWFIQNSPGSTRYLLLLLLFAGIQGMPGVEDLEELANAGIQKIFGKEFNAQAELRKMLVEMVGEDVPPDLFLHGISRYGFGLHHLGKMTGVPIPAVDMSGNIGMGSPLPVISPAIQAGAEMVQTGDYYEAMGKFTTEGVGATLGIPLNFLKAMTDTRLQWDDRKRWESAAPAAVGAASKGLRYWQEGEERSRSGSTVVEFDKDNPYHMAEMIAQGLGFRPTRAAQSWDKIIMQQEVERFWEIRRSLLYNQYDWARSKGTDEDVDKVRRAIARFNQQSPYPSLRITPKKLNQSYSQRQKSRSKQSAGLPNSKMMTGVYREIERLHPELQQNLYIEDAPSGR